MGRPRKEPELPVQPFHGAEGWQAFVPVGYLRDGREDRRHVRGKDETDVKNKIRKLLAAAEKKRVPRTSRTKWKVKTWFPHWLDSEDALKYLSVQTYEWAVNRHIIPGLSEWDLLALVDHPEHIAAFLKSLDKANGGTLKPVSVHSVYRTLRTALNDAVKAKIIGYNPMADIDPPEVEEEEIDPHTVEEAKRIIEVCDRRRNGTRWTVGAALGLRQGEALGLPWATPVATTREKPIGVNLATGFVDVRRKAFRRLLEHGCADPVACAGRHCRRRPCQPPWQHGCEAPQGCYSQAWRCKRRRPGVCKTHRKRDPVTGERICPKPCPPGCTAHARACPDKIGGITYDDVKSRRGRRRVAMAAPQLERMRAHKAAQDGEREAAGGAWEEHGLVWCQLNGRPVDTSMDRKEWIEIQAEAKVRRGRIHDERHLAATILLLLGVPDSVVMDIMGWADRRMLDRYQHVIDQMRREAARRVGDFLYPATPAPAPEPDPTPVSESFATDLATGDVVSMDAWRKRKAAG